MRTLCVIPARGGSKRIPRKNVRAFGGRPMIAWSIQAARRSSLFDHIIVSTDDPEIASVARDHGALVPFVRPQDLADDHTPTVPVIRHAITHMEATHGAAGLVCCLYATAPFLTVAALKSGFQALVANPSLEFALGITRFDFPIFRAIGLDDQQSVKMFWPEHELTRSQDLPAAYHDAGQFVWGNRKAWMNRDRVFSSRTRGIVIPSSQVQDIDTEDDWNTAEWKFSTLQRTATQ